MAAYAAMTRSAAWSASLMEKKSSETVLPPMEALYPSAKAASSVMRSINGESLPPQSEAENRFYPASAHIAATCSSVSLTAA